MPAFVKVRLTESSGGKEVYINPALVLSVLFAEEPENCIIMLVENKAYIIEGTMYDIAQLLSY